MNRVSPDSEDPSGTLVVNEIYLSLQGESTFAGLPCVFIRLTGCNLRCSYCDTAYAFSEGARMPIGGILTRVDELAAPHRHFNHPAPRSGPPSLPIVELTGGEPLLQRESATLMRHLCDRGYTVLVETSGAHDITHLDPRIRRIMDLKCPSSGECERNRWENIPSLTRDDEIKFVIGTEADYHWARHQIERLHLADVSPILFSWAGPLSPGQRHPSLKKAPESRDTISRRDLVERIIADALPVRFQIQMHKVIWEPDERGV